jgi:CRP-like cAMP-binding protein
MANGKLNCWEYKKCAREKRDRNTGKLSICPAASDASFDGINSGNNGGRFCWAVAGTCCAGKVQGTYAQKRESCMDCDFYKMVCAEEGTANLRTKFLRFVPLGCGGSFLRDMTIRHINKGERFINQGDRGEASYIIQSGSALLLVEKEGEFHPVDHRGEGDILGMSALFTGEPRQAHAEAESNMVVWVISRAKLDEISANDPDLIRFLTEIVADRFDSKRPVAERTIGKYIATGIIGRGGYSIVYKGAHQNSGFPVAIKMMRHDLTMKPEFLSNFRNEAKIISNLNHRGIIRVYDVEERFKTLFIIMEHLEGESLNDMRKRLNTLPPGLATNIITQVGRALLYAHEQGIVHRDINPDNMFVQNNGRIKLLDFGLACPIGTDDYQFGGAMSYLAPELLDGEPADQRSDIYSLGITAYELVTGKRPYPEESAANLIKMKRSMDIPDLSEEVPGLTKNLRRFISKSCIRDPHKRYQDMGQALGDLLSPQDKCNISSRLRENT